MPDAQGFPRSHRLLRPEQFKRIFEGADRRLRYAPFTLLAVANSCAHPRLGMAIAKKHVKKAVQRNRIRRQIRESFRLHQHRLPAADILILGRPGMDLLPGPELKSLLERAWAELVNRCEKS